MHRSTSLSPRYPRHHRHHHGHRKDRSSSWSGPERLQPIFDTVAWEYVERKTPVHRSACQDKNRLGPWHGQRSAGKDVAFEDQGPQPSGKASGVEKERLIWGDSVSVPGAWKDNFSDGGNSQTHSAVQHPGRARVKARADELEDRIRGRGVSWERREQKDNQRNRIRSRRRDVNQRRQTRSKRGSASLSNLPEQFSLRPTRSPRRPSHPAAAIDEWTPQHPQRKIVYRYPDAGDETREGDISAFWPHHRNTEQKEGGEREQKARTRSRSRERQTNAKSEIQGQEKTNRQGGRSKVREQFHERLHHCSLDWGTALRPCDSISYHPSLHNSLVESCTSRRPFMRTVSSDDYLLARGANPRTGLISPSVWTPCESVGSSDSGSPTRGPLYPDLSPGARKGSALEWELKDKVEKKFREKERKADRERDRKRADRDSSGTKWRLKGDEWVSIAMDVPTPGPYGPNAGPSNPNPTQTQRTSADSDPNNVQLRELQDRFVVNMPSARDPDPPQMSTASIEEFQRGIQAAGKDGRVTVNVGTLPSPFSSPKVTDGVGTLVRSDSAVSRYEPPGSWPRTKSTKLNMSPIIEQGGSGSSKGAVLPNEKQWAGDATVPSPIRSPIQGSSGARLKSEVKRKPIGSPISNPAGLPTRDGSMDTVIRRIGNEAIEHGRADSVPSTQRYHTERRTPSWNSPDDVGKDIQLQRPRHQEVRDGQRWPNQSRVDDPFLGQRNGQMRAEKPRDPNAPIGTSLSSTWSQSGCETAMSAFQCLPPLGSKTAPGTTVKGGGEGTRSLKEKSVEKGQDVLGEEEKLQREVIDKTSTNPVCKCCTQDGNNQSREGLNGSPEEISGDEKVALSGTMTSPPGQILPSLERAQTAYQKRIARQHIQQRSADVPSISPDTAAATATSTSNTTTRPPRANIPLRTQLLKRQMDIGVVERRPRPKRTAGAANVPQLNTSQAPKNPWFLGPKVDLTTGWEVMGTGKGVKMGIVKTVPGGMRGGRVPVALIPGMLGMTGGNQCQCQSQGRGRTACMILGLCAENGGRGLEINGAAQKEENAGLDQQGGCGSGDGCIRRHGNMSDDTEDGASCECMCTCSPNTQGGLRAKAIENNVRTSRFRLSSCQKIGEVAELDPKGDSRKEEAMDEDGNHDDLKPHPLKVKPKFGKDGGDGDDSETDAVSGTLDADTTLQDIDIRLSSILALVNHTQVLLRRHRAPEHIKRLVGRLGGMIAHVFHTAVKLCDVFLVERYLTSYPNPKARRLSAMKNVRNKDQRRLETIKLARDCAIASCEVLVLLSLGMLLGRLGMCVVWGLTWFKWVFGWFSWMARGLLWG